MTTPPDRITFDLRDHELGERHYWIEYGNPRHCPTCEQHTQHPVYLIANQPTENDYTRPPMATYCPNCPPQEDDQ